MVHETKWPVARMTDVADVTSVSILWSQPIAALQILSIEGEWRWVKHIANALVGFPKPATSRAAASCP